MAETASCKKVKHRLNCPVCRLITQSQLLPNCAQSRIDQEFGCRARISILALESLQFLSCAYRPYECQGTGGSIDAVHGDVI
jgi:hypothetical protein